MTKQLMIYERASPISSERHREWSVKQEQNYGFARGLNSVPLLAAEFLAAAPSYTIVFAGDEETVFPSVVLGMRQDDNAFVDGDGKWTGEYVPAFLRRYPFVFSRSEDGKTFTLCIDEEFDGFNRDGVGERMFDSEGNRTSFLENMLTFTREYQTLFERTALFCRRLKENDLLEAATAQFTMPGGETGSLAGFFTISREKLKALPPDTLAEMARTDELELCYSHLHSLNNLTPVARRVAESIGAAPVADPEPEADDTNKKKAAAKKKNGKDNA